MSEQENKSKGQLLQFYSMNTTTGEVLSISTGTENKKDFLEVVGDFIAITKQANKQ